MIHLKATKYGSTGELLEDALSVAHFYGFLPLEEAIRDRRARMARAHAAALQANPALQQRPQREIREIPDVPQNEIAYARRDERSLTSAVRSCASGAHGPALFGWRIVPGAKSGLDDATALELHIGGIEHAIAEAILIRVADAIAERAGLLKRTLSINSIGTPDSSNRYVRDIGMYLRKHLESISPALRPKAAEDPLATLIQLIERGHPAAVRAPASTEYLTEEERRRFWDLLEYLEIANMAYELDPRVLGSRDCWAHTLFEISWIDPDSGARISVARGGRYDPLISRFAGRRTHGAAVTIFAESRGRTVPRQGKDKRHAPLFYFAHLGPEARRKVLPVLESLRLAEIQVHQSLMHERIGDQMSSAEQLGVPYVLIMGHKEAVEGTILVREVATNSQRAVPVEELPGFLRRYKARA